MLLLTQQASSLGFLVGSEELPSQIKGPLFCKKGPLFANKRSIILRTKKVPLLRSTTVFINNQYRYNNLAKLNQLWVLILIT